MVSACRSVFFTLCLLVLLLYIFGIAFRQITAETEVGEELFSGVAPSMYTLLIQGTFLDSVGDTADAIGRDSMLAVVMFFLFVLLSAMMVMNMLIGVLCEVVSAVGAAEQDQMA